MLYPNCAPVNKLRESDEEFMLYKYKREYGKAYQRINFYICPSRDYNDYTVNELANVFAESSESDKEAVTSDGENIGLTYQTDTSETTSNVTATPGNLSTSLTVTKSVNARLKTKENGTSSMVTATLESLPSSSYETNPMSTTFEATSVSHQGNTLSAQSHTLGENLECLHESITELFPQCNPAQARAALLATDNNLKAAVNLVISNQAQPSIMHEGIFASFDFCNDIRNDSEFAETNNPSDNKAALYNVDDKIISTADGVQLCELLSQQCKNKIKIETSLGVKARRSHVWEDVKVKLNDVPRKILNKQYEFSLWTSQE